MTCNSGSFHSSNVSVEFIKISQLFLVVDLTGEFKNAWFLFMPCSTIRFLFKSWATSISHQFNFDPWSFFIKFWYFVFIFWIEKWTSKMLQIYITLILLITTSAFASSEHQVCIKRCYNWNSLYIFLKYLYSNFKSKIKIK